MCADAGLATAQQWPRPAKSRQVFAHVAWIGGAAPHATGTRRERAYPHALEITREDERRSNRPLARRILQGARSHHDPRAERRIDGTDFYDDLGDRVSTSRTEPSDEILMIRFQGGDRSAFTFLLRRHQTPLYNFVLRHLGSAPAAEEVVQDAFVRVVQNASDFKHEARFSTWLYAIARNQCIDQIRKRALRRHPSLDEPKRAGPEDGPTLGERTADGRADVERAAVSGEIRERLLAAVEQLPDEQREVFLMREVSSLPFKEIAQIVGVPENTVKSRMRYALERLQAALSEFEEYARGLR
jgi:RNA polymerase sigma-70 factor (ECF subfamily)